MYLKQQQRIKYFENPVYHEYAPINTSLTLKLYKRKYEYHVMGNR